MNDANPLSKLHTYLCDLQVTMYCRLHQIYFDVKEYLIIKVSVLILCKGYLEEYFSPQGWSLYNNPHAHQRHISLMWFDLTCGVCVLCVYIYIRRKQSSMPGDEEKGTSPVYHITSIIQSFRNKMSHEEQGIHQLSVPLFVFLEVTTRGGRAESSSFESYQILQRKSVLIHIHGFIAAISIWKAKSIFSLS